MYDIQHSDIDILILLNETPFFCPVNVITVMACVVWSVKKKKKKKRYTNFRQSLPFTW